MPGAGGCWWSTGCLVATTCTCPSPWWAVSISTRARSTSPWARPICSACRAPSRRRSSSSRRSRRKGSKRESGRFRAQSVQELSPRNAAWLEHSLEEAYPYRVLRGEYISGKGLLTRYPLVAWEHFALASGRPNIAARVAIEEQEVTVYVTHPPPLTIRRLEALSRAGIQDIRLLLERATL